ncbi:MAG TPA: helix-hairpin-helix domain-containing protein [Gemmatimonadales bacterium]|nr:helix-hairpin-helix domain-containing protein [Gemmatimonadales bacterium]
MSPRRAALSLLGLAAAGHLALHWRGSAAVAPGEVLSAPRGGVSPTAQRDSVLRASRPLGADERVDVDRASARELERLPGIGPGLAARIVADREAHGSFGGLAGFDRVPGVGPALLGRVAPHAAFSGVAADSGRSSTPDTGVRLQPGETLLLGPPDPPPVSDRRRTGHPRRSGPGH